MAPKEHETQPNQMERLAGHLGDRLTNSIGMKTEQKQPDAGASPIVPYLTIRPTSGWAAVDVADIWRFRDLLLSLAGRDLKLRYKQTLLGVAWVILQPLLTAGIFSFVFGRLADFPSHGVPYFLFSYSGLLGWNLFSGTLVRCSTCLTGNSQLISKVFFPRLVLPLSTVPAVLVDFGVACVMLAVLMLVAKVSPGWSLALLPLWLGILMLFALGAGLCTAALSVSYRDVQYILPVATQALLYASPIAYALSDAVAKLSSPLARWLYQLNPLAAPLEAVRWSLLAVTPPPPPIGLAVAAGVSATTFLIGAYSFKRMERSFADVI